MSKIFSTSLLLFIATVAQAQNQDVIYHINQPAGEIIVPSTTLSDVKTAGQHFHTNHIIYVPDHKVRTQSGYFLTAETPASIACVYQLTSVLVPGCPIASTTSLPAGGRGKIALIELAHYANAQNDLNAFSTAFNLPQPTFSLVTVDGGGNYNTEATLEILLDIEWAHAMAPNAAIEIVEGPDSGQGFYDAFVQAGEDVLAAGGGAVSASWGSSEYAGETTFDSSLQEPLVTYFVASGDSGAPAEYPASSPYVIAAGGTTIVRDSNGDFNGETAWSLDDEGHGGTGGPSAYESRPFFQDGVENVVRAQRGTPDISFDANPSSGVNVYDSDPNAETAGYCLNDWCIIGGTSLAAPALAGVINATGQLVLNTQMELSYIYSLALPGNYNKLWRDITEGYNGYDAENGYDFTTGIGSPLTYVGK